MRCSGRPHRAGRRTEPGILFGVPVTRQDILERTGTTLHIALHPVSRAMAAWEGDGMVSSDRRKVIVTDACGLRAVAKRPEE